MIVKIDTKDGRHYSGMVLGGSLPKLVEHMGIYGSIKIESAERGTVLIPLEDMIRFGISTDVRDLGEI